MPQQAMMNLPAMLYLLSETILLINNVTKMS